MKNAYLGILLLLVAQLGHAGETIATAERSVCRSEILTLDGNVLQSQEYGIVNNAIVSEETACIVGETEHMDHYFKQFVHVQQMLKVEVFVNDVEVPESLLSISRNTRNDYLFVEFPPARLAMVRIRVLMQLGIAQQPSKKKSDRSPARQISRTRPDQKPGARRKIH